MALTEVILLLFLTVLVIHWSRKKSSRLPGPWNLPVLGYLPWLDPKTPHLILTKLSKKYGPIYELNLGSIHTVVVSDVTLVKKIFLKDSASGRAPLYFIDSIFEGKGIIFAQSDLWKNQRKFIHDFLRAIGGNKVSQNKHKMESVVMESVLELIQYIESKGHKTPSNISEDIVHNVGSVISSVVLGTIWSRDDASWRQLIQFLDDGSKMLSIAGPLNFLPWLRILPTYKKHKAYIQESLKKTHAKYREIIGEKVSVVDGKNSISNLVEAFTLEREKQGPDSYYTDQQFYYLLSDVFGAGLETTTNSLLWFILHMAKYQDVQNRVRQEMADVLQGNRPTMDDMAMLPYLEAVICESARIRTVIPLGIPHGTLEDIHIDEIIIPKDTMVMPLLWAIHMDPEIWEDPETFRPERFISTEGKLKKVAAFIPFQIGKRMCVGEDLARMILCLFGSTLVQTFKIEPEPGTEVDLDGICGLTFAPKPQKVIFTKL